MTLKQRVLKSAFKGAQPPNGLYSFSGARGNWLALRVRQGKQDFWIRLIHSLNDNPEDIIAECEAIQKRAANATNLDGANQSLETLVEQYITERRLSKSTARHLNSAMRELTFDEYSNARIVAEKLNAVNDGGRRAIIAIISAFWNWAIKKQVKGLPTSPVDGLDIPQKRRRQRTLSTSEWNHLRTIIDTEFTPKQSAMLSIILDTGCRVSTVIAINRDAIDFNDGSILLTNVKCKRPYKLPIPLSNETLIRLQQLPSISFTKRTAETINRKLRELFGEKNGEPITCHSLRHSFATLMLEQGVSVDVVAAALDHSSVATTINTYVHVSTARLKGALELLSTATRLQNANKDDWNDWT